MADPIPAGTEGRVIPYLMIQGASKAIDFYKEAFGAEERYRMDMPDGSIGHADLLINGAPVYLADAPEDVPGRPRDPNQLGGTSVLLHQYVEDVDALVARAEAAGATVLRPSEDQFYGDRAATIQDPFGHLWSLHTHLRDMSPEEMEAAMDGS